MTLIAKKVTGGRTIPYTPTSADLAAGAVVVQGDLIGYATNPIAQNQLGALEIEGRVIVPKATGAGTDAAAGTKFYWDASEDEAVETDDSGANKLMGKSVFAVTTADTHVELLLTPDAA